VRGLNVPSCVVVVVVTFWWCVTTPKRIIVVVLFYCWQQLLHPGRRATRICCGLSTTIIARPLQSKMSTSMDALLEGVNAEFGGMKGQVPRPTSDLRQALGSVALPGAP